MRERQYERMAFIVKWKDKMWKERRESTMHFKAEDVMGARTHGCCCTCCT